MPQIRPIKDLRKTTEISALCHESNEPIFITKNGYGDLVVMSIEAYERTLAKLELYQKLDEAKKQLENKEDLLDGELVLRELRGKYGKRKVQD